MAKIKEREEKNEQDQIETLLNSKEFKGLHYGSRSGTEIEHQERITTSSFWFDLILEGGFRSGSFARMYSDPECGKTSMGLCWGRNWQDHYPDDGFVTIFNAEGRMTKDLIDRAGINTDKEKFRIIDCNNADAIFTLTEKLISDNSKKRRYYIMVDSTDSCQRSIDMLKNLGESEKIGGNATILSAAGKRLSLVFNRSNHFLYLSSQVRDRLNTMSPGAQGKDASGGNAPKFYSSLIGHIQKPWTDTYIFEDPSDTKSKVIGRLVTIKLIKTPNEKTGQTIQFPVKYGFKGGVWPAYEAFMITQAWNLVNKSGAWFNFTEQFIEDLKKANIFIETKFQGERAIREYFDKSPELVSYILKRFREVLISSS